MTGEARATPDQLPAAAVAAAAQAAAALLRLDAPVDPAGAAAAIEAAEAFLGTALIVRGFVQAIPGDGGWHALGAAPVRAIEAPTEGGAVDIDARATGWARGQGGTPLSVRFVAGLAAEWAGLPGPVAQGIAALAARWREGEAGVPADVAALWRPWRRVRLVEARR